MKHAFGRDFPETVPELLAIGSALLVWDMQHAIADRVSNRAQVVENTSRLLDAARAAGVPVVYSQHYSLPLPAEDLAWLRAQWKRSGASVPDDLASLAPPGSPQSAFLEEIAPTGNDIVLSKTRPSLFVGTPARDLLAAHGVHTLVLSGVTTDRGILATAMHAGFVGIVPVVAADAVGSYTDTAHKHGLARLEDVADTARTFEIEAGWSGLGSRRPG